MPSALSVKTTTKPENTSTIAARPQSCGASSRARTSATTIREIWSDDLRARLPREAAEDAGADPVRRALLGRRHAGAGASGRGIACSRKLVRSAASELALGTIAAGCCSPASAAAEPVRRLDERDEPRRGEPSAELQLVVVDGLAEAPSGAARRPGACRSRARPCTEPTPAWVTTTRARADRLDHLLEREEVDELGAGRLDRERVAVLDRRAPRRAGSSATARRSRSKRASFVPTLTKIMRPPRRRCRRSARAGSASASSGHWT